MTGCLRGLKAQEIQNEILKVMSNHILRKSTVSVKTSPFITIMTDEHIGGGTSLQVGGPTFTCRTSSIKGRGYDVQRQGGYCARASTRTRMRYAHAKIITS